MTFYCYDTEFLENGKTIDLISIGIVCEDGREYYAVNSDADWNRMLDAHVKPKWVIANEVRDFLLTRPSPELWAYHAAYDHVALTQLWGKMTSLPKGVPMWTHDLMQLIEPLQGFDKPPQADDEHHALADARWNMQLLTAARAHGSDQ